MISKKFLNKVKGKLVHIEYVNDRMELAFFEGTLDNADEDFVELSNDTDFVKIEMNEVRKIYLKEPDEEVEEPIEQPEEEEPEKGILEMF